MQRARGLLSQFLRKFIHDGLPVALAGAIGTMLFGQLGRPSAPPPLPAVQQPASDATMELMREEHALVLDLLKRQAETTRVANSAQENALEAKQLAAAADERAARARASPAKAPPISAAKPIHQKEMAAGDPLPLTPPAPTAGNRDGEELVLSGLWDLLRHYQFHREPLFAALKLPDADAEALLVTSRPGGRVLDPGDQIWLNRHLLEAAFSQATGHTCFRRLNSGLDGVIG